MMKQLILFLRRSELRVVVIFEDSSSAVDQALSRRLFTTIGLLLMARCMLMTLNF